MGMKLAGVATPIAVVYRIRFFSSKDLYVSKAFESETPNVNTLLLFFRCQVAFQTGIIFLKVNVAMNKIMF